MKNIRYLALFIPVLVGCVIAILVVFRGGSFSNEAGATSILSLAFATWAGLNISNAIEKKELNDLEQKTQDINTLQNKSELRIQELEVLNQGYLINIQKETISALELSEDEFYQYFAELLQIDPLFSSKLDTNTFNNNENATALLIHFSKHVLSIEHIRQLHEQGGSKNKELIRKYADELNNEIQAQSYQIPYSELIYRISQYILADSMFYHAFSNYTNNQDSEKYLTSVNLFKKSADLYIRNKDYFINDGISNVLSRYYDNAIAQCYSEIMYAINSSKSEEHEKIEEIISFEEAEEKAEKYSKEICSGDSVGSNPRADERFFKNTGLINDRIAKKIEDEIESTDDPTIKNELAKKYCCHLSKAISDYEQALLYGGKQKNTYHVLCSAYNNLIARTISPLERIISSNSNNSIWKHYLSKDTNIKSIIEKLSIVTECAIIQYPDWELMHDLKILSILYLGYFEDAEGKHKQLEKAQIYFESRKFFSSRESGLEKAIANVINNIENDGSWKV